MASDNPNQHPASEENAPATPAACRERLPREVRHELRSRIGQVIGYAELWLDQIAEEGGLDDMAGLRRDLERMHAAGRGILDLVNAHIDPIGERAGADGVAPVAAPEPERG